MALEHEMSEDAGSRAMRRYTATLSAAMTVTASGAAQAMRYAKDDGSENVLLNHHEVDSIWEADSQDELTHDLDGISFEGNASDDFGDGEDESDEGDETEGDVTCTFSVTFLARDEETASLIAIGIPGRAEQIGRLAESLQNAGVGFSVEDLGDLMKVTFRIESGNPREAYEALWSHPDLSADERSDDTTINVSLRCHEDLAATAVETILEADDSYWAHCATLPKGASIRYDPKADTVGSAHGAAELSPLTRDRLRVVAARRKDQSPITLYPASQPPSASARAAEAQSRKEAMRRREREAGILVAQIGGR